MTNRKNKRAMQWQDMTEGKEKYAAYLCSREWSVKRRAVERRCNGVCERCHLNDMECVHHLTYARKYKEHLDDLAGWCNDCHSYVHGKSDFCPVDAYEVIQAAYDTPSFDCRLMDALREYLLAGPCSDCEGALVESLVHVRRIRQEALANGTNRDSFQQQAAAYAKSNN